MKQGRFEKCGGGEARNAAPTEREVTAAPNGQTALLLEPNPAEAEQLARQAALETFRQELAQKPDSALAWYHYGDALLALGRAEQAVPALRKAVELCPEMQMFHYDLGLALYYLEQTEAAQAEFAGVVADDPKLKCAWSNLMQSALTNLALCQEKLGRRDEASETLLPALEPAVNILFNLGFLHFRAKRYEAALPYAQAAYLLKPNNEDIVHQYGAILSELERPREAVRILKEATQLNPGCAGAWYDLGLAHARLKQRRVARRCFLKSLEVEPRHAWSHYDLACLEALEGKLDGAFKQLREALLRGFRDLAHLRRDDDLRSLRRDARWKDLIRTISEREYSNN